MSAPECKNCTKDCDTSCSEYPKPTPRDVVVGQDRFPEVFSQPTVELEEED